MKWTIPNLLHQAKWKSPLGHKGFNIEDLDEMCHLYLHCLLKEKCYSEKKYNMSQCMRFPTMWYVRPAKPQISLRIRAV